MARRTDDAGAAALRGQSNVDVLVRSDGTLLALFANPFWLERFERDHPDVLLERLLVR